MYELVLSVPEYKGLIYPLRRHTLVNFHPFKPCISTCGVPNGSFHGTSNSEYFQSKTTQKGCFHPLISIKPKTYPSIPKLWVIKVLTHKLKNI